MMQGQPQKGCQAGQSPSSTHGDIFALCLDDEEVIDAGRPLCFLSFHQRLKNRPLVNAGCKGFIYVRKAADQRQFKERWLQVVSGCVLTPSADIKMLLTVRARAGGLS